MVSWNLEFGIWKRFLHINNFVFFKLILFFIFCFLFSSQALAQVDIDSVVKSNEDEPINITSENLIIKNAENLSIFRNNVYVKQGEMELRASEMKVYSETDIKTNKSKFKIIEASGNVDFIAEDKTAKSDFAVYDVKAGKLKLTNNVRLTDADTVLQGRVFEYNVKTKQSKISNLGKDISASKNSTNNVNTDAKPDPAAPPINGRSKVTFTPGEGIKTFGMPMDTLNSMRGKDKKEGE